MAKKSRRFYVVVLWQGEDVKLSDQETGRAAMQECDERRFTRKRAEEICSALNAKYPGRVREDYFGPYEVREEE